MAIVHLGAKRVQGIKTDRVSDSLGSSADGTNTGITLINGKEITWTSSGSTTTFNSVTKSASSAGWTNNYAHSQSYSSGIVIVEFDPNVGQGYGSLCGFDDGTNNSTPTDITLGMAGLTSASNCNTIVSGTSTDHGSNSWASGDIMKVEYNIGTGAYSFYRNGGTAFRTGTISSPPSSVRILVSSYSQNYKVTEIKLSGSGTSATANLYKLGTGAYSFDGSNDYVENSSTNLFGSSWDKFSIVGWVKPDDATTAEYILGTTARDGNTNNFNFIQQRSDGKFQGTIGDNSTQVTMNSTTTYSAGTWYHLALVYDGSASTKCKLYVNGSLEASSTSGATSYSVGTKLSIGRQGTSGQTFFDGAVDDVAYFKRVLTATEIEQLSESDGILYNGLSGQTASDGFPSSATVMGAKILSPINSNLAGKTVTKVKFLLTKPSSGSASTGLLKSQIIDTDGSLLATSTNSVNVTTITTWGSWTTAEFTFNNVELPATATGLRFTVYFDSGGNGNIHVGLGAESETNNERSYGSASGASATWTDQSAYEICMQIEASPSSAQLVSSLSDKSNLKANYTMDSTSLGATASIDDDFSSDNFTNVGSQSGWGVSSNSMAWTTSKGSTAQGEYIALPSTFSGNFVVRFKLTPTTVVAASSEEYLWVGLTNSTSCNSATSQNQAGFYFHNYSSTDSKYQVTYATNTGLFSGAVATSINFSSTAYWVEIIKDGDSVKLTLYSDEYVTAVSGGTATSTAGGATDSYTHFVLTGMYHGSQTGNGSNLGTIDDLKIYKDVTSLDGCKNDFSSTSALDGQTNLPVNTIFEQTDDTPTYYWKQSDNTWKIDGTTGVPKGIDGLYAWFDANDSSTITKDSSNKVSKWTDKSGNSLGSNLDLLQSSSSLQPTWTSGDKNGLPTLNFSGSWLKTDTSVSIPSESQPITYFFVAKTSGSSGERILFDGSYSSSSNYDTWRQNIGNNGSGNWFVDGGSTSTGVTTNTWYYATAVFNGSSGQLNLNGTTISSTLTTGARQLRFGTFGNWSADSPTQRWEGKIAEFIVYNRLLTSAEILEVEAYLKDKWGL